VGLNSLKCLNLTNGYPNKNKNNNNNNNNNNNKVKSKPLELRSRVKNKTIILMMSRVLVKACIAYVIKSLYQELVKTFLDNFTHYYFHYKNTFYPRWHLRPAVHCKLSPQLIRHCDFDPVAGVQIDIAL
jgi:hypothetical protein